MSKEAVNSDAEKDYLRHRENTPLQKDPNYAGNRAWTTRGSNVPMALQLNDTLDANNLIGHSDQAEIEDKKSITALAPYSPNIVTEQGVVESNSLGFQLEFARLWMTFLKRTSGKLMNCCKASSVTTYCC